MQTNDTIRRAMMRTPQPALPASFTPQLMVRVRRRSRLRTLMHNAAITAMSVLVVAAAIAALVRFMPGNSMEQPSPETTPTAVTDLRPEPLSQTLRHLLPEMPELPSLPKLPRVEMTDALHESISFWALISGAMLLLLMADTLLRLHMRQRRRHMK